MLPVMLDLASRPVVLYGAGGVAVRRLRLLDEAGAGDVRVYGDAAGDPELRAAAGARLRGAVPGPDEIRQAFVIFVAGIPDGPAEQIARMARDVGVPVNVEDRKALCDFYTPSVVRRGDLVIAVSTGGKSPGLARRLRQELERRFGPEWAERLDRLAEARQGWRAEGADLAVMARRTDEFIEKEGWL